VWLSKLFLPSTAFTICQTFQCSEYDDGDFKFLVADRDVDCYSDHYNGLLAYAILMFVVFPVGVPLLWLVNLQGLRPHILAAGVPEEGGGEGAGARRDSTGRVLKPGTVVIEEDPVLSTSPFQVLFAGKRERGWAN
jgi:hypothetical protein